MPARCRNDRYRDQPAGFRTIAEGALRPRSCRLEFGLASRPRTGDRPAESTAERSKVIAVGRGGECNEHTRPAVLTPTSLRPRSGRIVSPRDNVCRSDAAPIVLLAIQESMRPLRGRRALGGGTAGRPRARCTRPRATHGYFLRPLRGRPPSECEESWSGFASRTAERSMEIAEIRTSPRSLIDRGAVGGNSRGSRGRVQRAHATRGTAANLGPTAERSHRQSQRYRASRAMSRPSS